MNGALLINKHVGVTSFGVIELLQRQWMEHRGLKRRDLPKMGHCGTLDPFATGLLTICAGRAVKLTRYFLGSEKSYEGIIRFGETTVPGDPTAPIHETSDHVPNSLEEIQNLTTQLTRRPYQQIPPMHSAKKRNGKCLYELAREGIEVEREPKTCQLYRFEILAYEKPRATFRLSCSSGTYVRTLAQDVGKLLGSVALLESLHRTGAGGLSSSQAWSCEEVGAAVNRGNRWDELDCWIPFDLLLSGYCRAEATEEEKQALFHGKQDVLFNILKRVQAPSRKAEGTPLVAIYRDHSLIAIATNGQNGIWRLDRVFN